MLSETTGRRRHDGRRMFVTGAAHGIGRATVLRLLGEGGRVFAVDIDAEALALLRDEAGGESLRVRRADVTREADLAAAVSDAVEAWGGLDAIVANAAVEPVAEDAPVHELDAATLRRIVDVNLVGLTLTCKHGLRALLAAGGGSVVCTASPTGLYGVAPDEAAYSISKSGAVGLTRVIAAGYASRRIRANAVVPGFTDTRVNAFVIRDPGLLADALRGVPLGRPGSPDEVASVISYLASDEASYVTGAVWAADGGLTAV
jgi:3-oxoacyl-[acyl-carrier protein] reductase